MAYLNIFVVSLLKDVVDGINITSEVTGTMDQFSADTDYTENFDLHGAVIKINSAKFKVHTSKYFTLPPQTPTVPFPVGQIVGTPYSTWRKWSWNSSWTVTDRFKVFEYAE